MEGQGGKEDDGRQGREKGREKKGKKGRRDIINIKQGRYTSRIKERGWAGKGMY